MSHQGQSPTAGLRLARRRNKMALLDAVTSRRPGAAIVAAAAVLALAAPFLAPHPVDARFDRLLNAPPTLPHVRDAAGGWHTPFVYPWVLVNQLEQQYEQDRSTRVPLRWLQGGHLVQAGSGD